MSGSAIFVTGETRTVGASVVRHLLDRGVAAIAGVRSDPDATQLASGAQVRQFVFLSLQGAQTNRRTPHHAVEAYLRKLRRRSPSGVSISSC